MNASIQNIIQQIHQRIDATRHAMYREEFFRGLVSALSLSVILCSVILLLEAAVGFGETIRTILFYGMWITVIVSSVRYIGPPLLRLLKILPQATDEEIARIIGTHFEKIGDRLENAMDLSEMVQKEDASYSPELVEMSLEHFQRSTSRFTFSDAISYDTVRRNAKIISTVTMVVILFALIPGTQFSGAMNRLWNYDTAFERPAPFTLIVTPGNTQVVKGESVMIRALAKPSFGDGPSSIPEEITLLTTVEGVSEPEHITLKKDSTNSYRYLLADLKSSTTYSFTAGDVTSRDYRISVLDRPFLRSMNISITPPSYTRLTRQTLEQNIGDVVALPGSRIEWTIVPSKALKQASIVFTHDRRIAFVKEGDMYHAWYTTRVSGPYWIELEDAQGIVNSDAIEYRMNIIPDEFPTVQIITPGQNTDVTKSMQLPMEFKVNDDFGITKLKLAFRLVQSKYSKPEENYGVILPFDTIKISSGILPYDWDMSVMGLVPEDVVEYYAEVFDNDIVNGPKSGKSQTYLIRLPSMEEIFADADKLHDDASDHLEQSMKEAEELKKSIDDLSNDVKRNQQMDWQKQNKAEDIAKKYQDIQKKFDEVNKKMEAMTQTLQRNNVLSPETVEKYAELQKMMHDMNAPEFQDALKKMQQAMQNISPQQLREAMQQVQFSEEQFRSSIERTLNLLKRIQIEEKLDELVKRTAEMKKNQEELQKETENMESGDVKKAEQLSKRQEDIQKQLTALQKSMENLQGKMEEFSKEMPMQKMSEAQASANDKELKEAIQQSVQNLRSMQVEHALTSQQQAQSKMQDVAQQLSELQEQLLNNQMQQTMTALRKATQDMLELSQKQEQLKNKTKSLDPNSQQFRDVGQEQQSIQGDLSNVSNGLAELSQKSFVVTPEMGKNIGTAMNQMQQAMTGVEQRNGPMTSASQGEAMAALNKSATLLQNAMQSLQKSGGQGGGMSLMQQLRNMAMQQQGINMQTQQMSDQNGLTPQQMQEMGRLARQQDEVRKSLEQLNKEAQTTPEKNRILGDLQKIADDMKEVVEQMQQNDINPNTVKQQEKILSRLLQAQHSTRERDFEERRRATAGTAIIRKSPTELTLQSKESQLQKDLRRAVEAGYSKDYIDLIRKYYDALNRSN